MSAMRDEAEEDKRGQLPQDLEMCEGCRQRISLLAKQRPHHHPPSFLFPDLPQDYLPSTNDRNRSHAAAAPPIHLRSIDPRGCIVSMGSDGKPGPGSAAEAPVCCMCGDHGLLPELFRCAACSLRSQHTYCTDRYPKAEAYGACNWCLRAGQENGGAATPSPARSTFKAPARPPPSAHCGDVPACSSVSRSLPGKVAARGDFTGELNKPIKKQQQRRRLLLQRSASDLSSGVRANRGAGPPSPGVGRGRPRVRRYKLLEEVISS
ncbi:hypothetical protein D1007_57045 [Hordeum vulgare]|nr:hypothetical protein D1007_57045 [Hordeum vulgare]